MQSEIIGLFQWRKHKSLPAVKSVAHWKSTQFKSHRERERGGGEGGGINYVVL